MNYEPCSLSDKKQRAIVDSAEIIKYIDREIKESPLLPNQSHLAQMVQKQANINDTMPHPGILYGFHKNDPRPDFYKKMMEGIYDRKRAALELLIEQNKDDDELVKVYKAKLMKIVDI